MMSPFVDRQKRGLEELVKAGAQSEDVIIE